MDKKVIEVIESYKQSLRDTLEGHGDIVEDLGNEGTGKPALLVKNHGIRIFFEFEDFGGKNVYPEGTYNPIILMTVSTIIYIPKLTLKERVAIMEMIAEFYGVMMKNLENNNYIFKAESFFVDDLNMTVNAVHGAGAILATHDFISKFLRNKKK